MLNAPVGPHPEAASEENLGHQAWQASPVKAHPSSWSAEAEWPVCPTPNLPVWQEGRAEPSVPEPSPKSVPDAEILTMVMTTTSKVREE